MSLPTLSLGCVRMSSLDDGDGLHYLSSVLCVNRAIVLNHFCLMNFAYHQVNNKQTDPDTP
jgi:hypothetical protein